MSDFAAVEAPSLDGGDVLSARGVLEPPLQAGTASALRKTMDSSRWRVRAPKAEIGRFFGPTVPSAAVYRPPTVRR